MKSTSRTAAGLIAWAAFATSAGADFSSNFWVFENAGGAPTGALDLTLQLQDGGGHADLIFTNASTTPSFVSAVYVEATAFTTASLANVQIIAPQGVAFAPGAKPPNPPGSIAGEGGAWGGNFFSASAIKSGTGKDGIDPGESLTLRMDLTGIGFSDLVAALSDPLEFRIAQHVQGLEGGQSVWTLNSPVPSPAASALLGLGALAAARRRRR